MRPPKTTVGIVEGAKEDFFHRHRKDVDRADAAWSALVAKGPRLAERPDFGDSIPRDRWPSRFSGLPRLVRLELPGAFRALYTILRDDDGHVVVRIEWIGDHKEYDRLFGYSTS